MRTTSTVGIGDWILDPPSDVDNMDMETDYENAFSEPNGLDEMSPVESNDGGSVLGMTLGDEDKASRSAEDDDRTGINCLHCFIANA